MPDPAETLEPTLSLKPKPHHGVREPEKDSQRKESSDCRDTLTYDERRRLGDLNLHLQFSSHAASVCVRLKY